MSPIFDLLPDSVSDWCCLGVSLITQALYCVVFVIRYLDLFSNLHDFLGFWNFSLKVFYISSSLYIVFLMTRVYARTREREKAWKLGIWSVLGSVVGAPIVAAIFVGKDAFKWRNLFDVSLSTYCVLKRAMLTIPNRSPTPSRSSSNRSAFSHNYSFCARPRSRPSSTASISLHSALTAPSISSIGSFAASPKSDTKISSLSALPSASFRLCSTSTLLGYIGQDSASSCDTVVWSMARTLAEAG